MGSSTRSVVTWVNCHIDQHFWAGWSALAWRNVHALLSHREA